MSADDLGDRMKLYEGMEAGRRAMPLLPVCARIDGRSFSSFTRGMARPFDPAMHGLMVEVTRTLVHESNALIGYTQSDEITLILYSDSLKSQVFFDGRLSKLTSVLAAVASVEFNARLPEVFPHLVSRRPVFDCRVWTVPSKEEAANLVLWRERDATKNSISMAAREHFSPNEMHGKSGTDLQAMLLARDVNWNDYPEAFKRGTYVRRIRTSAAFTQDEIDALPPRHEARRNPTLTVERSVFWTGALPPFGRVANRAAVIFEGADPIVGERP